MSDDVYLLVNGQTVIAKDLKDKDEFLTTVLEYDNINSDIEINLLDNSPFETGSIPGFGFDFDFLEPSDFTEGGAIAKIDNISRSNKSSALSLQQILDSTAAAERAAAENKRFNNAISAFDREVLLQNRKFEDEARRLSDIAARTKSQYDIQAAQRAVATAERNKAEQAANFELQMDSFDNTQGDFFRDTSTAADPSRAMRSAYVGNQSPLAQYAQRVQDLTTASNQEKLDIQQERISEADRQAQAAIQDRQDAANAAEREAAQKETNRQLAASVVSRSVGASRLSTDQKESLIQTRLDGGDWETEMASFNTVSSDVSAPQGSVDVAAENAVLQSRPQPNSGENNYGWGGIPL